MWPWRTLTENDTTNELEFRCSRLARERTFVNDACIVRQELMPFHRVVADNRRQPVSFKQIPQLFPKGLKKYKLSKHSVFAV